MELFLNWLFNDDRIGCYIQDLQLRLVCKKTNTLLNLDGLAPSILSADGPGKIPIVLSPDPPSPAVRALFWVSGRRPLLEKALLSPVPSSFSPVEGPTDKDF